MVLGRPQRIRDVPDTIAGTYLGPNFKEIRLEI